jgi:ParB/Sulfiredoxin domain
MTTTPTTEYVPIDDLVPFPGNPRRGNVAAIKQSLEENGQYRPIVVRRQTREVLAGNHTLQAAKELGGKRSPLPSSTATRSRRSGSSSSTTAPTTSRATTTRNSPPF